tara:strand:+ start:133 stop:474 length:342 start_codon:yes stop_codon:yes gene_type:complete
MNTKLLIFPLVMVLFVGCGEEPMKVTVNTPSIQCGMCQKAIEVGLSKITGVKHSKVDLATKTTLVLFDSEKSDLKTIENTISKLGYQANDTPSDPIAYESLPACCKIGGMDKM